MAEKKVVKRKGVKNVRKTKRRRARNQRENKTLKTALKAARAAVLKNAVDAADKLKTAMAVIDKASEKGIIHRNKASRLKSRLFLAYNKKAE
ncbi:30S ribosomal protein S20 [Candidatus Saganbacteria bacterium]|uniref:Small ribosomal subunit protein bS20 n=1 Tax=Candidatus Saganbacteria bacterium TaxID=2575572 RepID=A0A9D6YXB8_UNCSA|nr:30S ribosomal protein S20 [Candidatus Saganbacteria bacterium]